MAEIQIGGAEPSQIQIPDEKLAPVHISLKAERLGETVRTLLTVVGGPVKKGYEVYQIGDAVELVEASEYQMGDTKFTYTPDFQY